MLPQKDSAVGELANDVLVAIVRESVANPVQNKKNIMFVSYSFNRKLFRSGILITSVY